VRVLAFRAALDLDVQRNSACTWRVCNALFALMLPVYTPTHTPHTIQHTYRYETLEGYRGYFLSHAAFVVRALEPGLDADGKPSATGDVIGCFYVKPNFPGRCSHVCNGGFITKSNFRKQGAGRLMGACFLRLGRDLGYKLSYFNLVFESNPESYRLWDGLLSLSRSLSISLSLSLSLVSVSVLSVCLCPPPAPPLSVCMYVCMNSCMCMCVCVCIYTYPSFLRGMPSLLPFLPLFPFFDVC
jgi:hypothetical protein